ncbi:MAG: TonB-dependent receptor, partial [Acidobacteria bacterium]|nr:TonB-dependent receptor [Acidobacteriota bacterium]
MSVGSRVLRGMIGACLLTFLGPQAVLRGQTNFATITGLITDPTQAAIADATVTVRHLDTNIARQVLTAATGDYTLTNLVPGAYELMVESSGFRPHRRTGILLEVGQTARLDIALELGAVTESVTVNTSAPLINTEVGAIKGDVISHQEIQELPLDGRDFTDLAFFVPGVVPKAQGGQGSAMNINGARATNTNFYVDGFNNRNARGAAAQIRPNIDALQEFKMEVSGFSAEYGRMAGGILNMVLRSGTNQFHGSLFEYLRNDKYDARGFFEVDKNKLRRNQFGATLGGPIVRNRTFFLVSYEGYTQSVGLTRLGHTPTAAERAGDFSSSVDFLGKPIYLKDPLAPGLCNAKNSAACFPGNRIPASRFDPVGLNILNYYPAPNRADIRNNYLVTANDDDVWHSILAKVDHRFSEKDTIAFRAQKRFNRTENPFAGGSELGIFGQSIEDDRSLAGLDWTHMFSPTFLMEFRTGFSRNSARNRGQFQGRDIASELGLPSLTTDPELLDFPKITVRDHFQIGTGDNQPVQYHVTDIQYNQKVTWVAGRHVVKAGLDVSRVRFNQPYFNNIRGTYNFQGRWTGAPIGDLLLGLLNNSSRQVGFARNYYRSTSYGFFFNDDWKIGRSLTLNLGMRYEINKPPADRYDRIANFV